MSGEKPRFCFTVSLKLRPLFLGVITGELAKALLHIVLYSFSETTASVFLGVITGELVKADFELEELRKAGRELR